MATPHGHTHRRHDGPRDREAEHDDPPSIERVERFLDGMDARRMAARRTRWVALGVGGLIAGVATLTALGVITVEAEHVVLSAGAVVAGLALGKG